MAEPWWENAPDENGLILRLGEHSAVVPPQIAGAFLARYRPTGDVAADVLRMDAHLRDVEMRSADKSTAGFAEYARLGQLLEGLGKSWFNRIRRAELRAEAEKARASWNEASRIHAEVVTLKRLLRSFVMSIHPESGLLAEAAAGWARSPEVPADVAVFDDVTYFLADTRRDAAHDGLPGTIGGQDYGDLWRREGDDPVEQPLARAGCWRVGFIPRTGEIYAVRRCGSETREVWLLGRNFSTSRVHSVLQPLMTRMQEPNSLILVAEEVMKAAYDSRGDQR
ncbi:hypothetical protein ACIQUM_33165 [Amycolatopsis azurea]|uniref:hypothetical protein n=1 Tax=Amycolatopsis azurea TaxID=36819 RepID=UPI0037F200C1